MKSQIHKRLALFAMLISLVFVVTNVTAKKPVKPPPADDPNPPYLVAIMSHDGVVAPPLYQPYDYDSDCLGESWMQGGVYNVRFDKQPCATLTTDSTYKIGHIAGSGYIVLNIHRQNHTRVFDSAWIQGMAKVGGEMLVHVSDDLIDPDTPVSVEDLADGSFIVHLHADNAILWQCNSQRFKRKTKCETHVGTFAIDDLLYYADN